MRSTLITGKLLQLGIEYLAWAKDTDRRESARFKRCAAADILLCPALADLGYWPIYGLIAESQTYRVLIESIYELDHSRFLVTQTVTHLLDSALYRAGTDPRLSEYNRMKRSLICFFVALAVNTISEQEMLVQEMPTNPAPPDPVAFDEKLMTPMQDLSLSVYTINRLVLNDILLLGQAIQIAEQTYLKLKKFGRKALRELREVLTEQKYKLGTTLPAATKTEFNRRAAAWRDAQLQSPAS